MPSDNRGNQDKGSGSKGGHSRKDRDGSYAPEWLKRSRDDVQQTGKPLRKNAVVEAIMANDNSAEPGGQPQQSAPERASPKGNLETAPCFRQPWTGVDFISP